jgi:predicted metal-dependent hydrolase
MSSDTDFKLDDMTFSVRRNKRRRSIALVLTPEGKLRLLAPAWISLRDLGRFLRQHAGLIHHRVLRLHPFCTRQHESLKDGSRVFYLGKAHVLRVTRESQHPSQCTLRGDEIEINIPDCLSEEGLASEVKLELRLWYKKQARREFGERVEHWSARLGVSYGRLIVTSPERRWGSCNARDDIRLNWRLILATPELIDYVAAHELCHVVHKNHRAAFWRRLGSVMPDYSARRRQLRAWEKSVISHQ